MIRMYPELLWQGAMWAMKDSMLVNIMVDAVTADGGDEHEQFFLPLMAMIGFGAGAIIGSFI